MNRLLGKLVTYFWEHSLSHSWNLILKAGIQPGLPLCLYPSDGVYAEAHLLKLSPHSRGGSSLSSLPLPSSGNCLLSGHITLSLSSGIHRHRSCQSTALGTNAEYLCVFCWCCFSPWCSLTHRLCHELFGTNHHTEENSIFQYKTVLSRGYPPGHLILPLLSSVYRWHTLPHYLFPARIIIVELLLDVC